MHKKTEGSFRGLNPGPRATSTRMHPKRWNDVSGRLFNYDIVQSTLQIQNRLKYIEMARIHLPNHTTRPNNRFDGGDFVHQIDIPSTRSVSACKPSAMAPTIIRAAAYPHLSQLTLNFILSSVRASEVCPAPTVDNTLDI